METLKLETLTSIIVEQRDCVTSLIIPMKSIVKMMGGGIDAMEGRLLSASIEERDLILRSRNGDTPRWDLLHRLLPTHKLHPVPRFP